MTECIEHRGGQSSGYGMVWSPRLRRNTPAHRAAVEQVVGPLPRRLHVHHTCENKLCVNLFHLEIVGQRNHARLHKSGRPCKRGHDLARRNARGKCLDCRNLSQNRIRQEARHA